MRLLVCLVLCVATTAHADDGPARAYRAARAECGKPGKKIAALMADYFARWLTPASLGARTVAGWAALSARSRARFEKLAETKLLAAERANQIRALCNPRDTFVSEYVETCEVARCGRVWIRHPFADDDIGVGLRFRDAGGGWRFEGRDIPSADWPGSSEDPIRVDLPADLDAAIEALSRLPPS